MQEKPFVREMIKEAIQALDGKATYAQIEEYVHNEWSDGLSMRN